MSTIETTTPADPVAPATPATPATSATQAPPAAPVEPAAPEPLSGEDLKAYVGLRESSAIIETANAHHLEFSGAQAAAALNGLVTNNVLTLNAGDGQYAAALTAKGRIVADMRICRLGEERYLTSVNNAARSGWRALVRKFVNPRLARYAERAFHSIVFYGPESAHALDRALSALQKAATASEAGSKAGSPIDSTHYVFASTLAAPYSIMTGVCDGLEYHAIRLPALDTIPGYELLVPEALVDRVRQALSELTPGTAAALNVLRVEAGHPEWGVDMNDTTIPQEANLGALHALSFDKGCYTGQETVARIHFRGHVNRHLRLLRSETPLLVPAELHDLNDKPVGDVRSTVISPKYGPLAIAMVRRELEPGAELRAVSAGHPSVRAHIER